MNDFPTHFIVQARKDTKTITKNKVYKAILTWSTQYCDQNYYGGQSHTLKFSILGDHKILGPRNYALSNFYILEMYYKEEKKEMDEYYKRLTS